MKRSMGIMLVLLMLLTCICGCNTANVNSEVDYEEEVVTSSTTSISNSKLSSQSQSGENLDNTISKPVESEVQEIVPTIPLTEEEKIKAKIENWRNSPSQNEKKNYRQYSVDGDFMPGTIIVRFTQKATKENFYKNYTANDFPELDIEKVVCHFYTTREAVLSGRREPDKVGNRSIEIILKEKTKQAVIDGIKLIEEREDIYMALPSRIAYEF